MPPLPAPGEVLLVNTWDYLHGGDAPLLIEIANMEFHEFDNYEEWSR